MSVDMYERRFRQELAKLPPFKIEGKRSEEVWSYGFPAWRALFSSVCFWCHSTGYRLPTYRQFFELCRRAFTLYGPKQSEHLEFFQPPLLEGMRERVAIWYESGMSEAYLYSCLVDIIEDKMNAGIVYYDPRHDWKLKCDTAVVLNDRIMKISAFHGSLGDRGDVEARRDKVERVRKRNTSGSSHWDNVQAKGLKELRIVRDESSFREVNGVRLFTIEAINGLLRDVFEFAEVPETNRRYFDAANAGYPRR